MEISHPRRILAVSRPDEGLTALLKGTLTPSNSEGANT